MEVDKAFIQAVQTNYDWNRLAATTPSPKSEKHEDATPDTRAAKEEIIRPLREYVAEAKELLQKGGAFTSLIETRGYSLALLKRLLFKLGRCSLNSMPFVDDAARLLRASENLSDVIVIQKVIKPGVQSTFPIVSSDGKVMELGTVSKIASELDRACLLFPPFFVYLLKPKLTEDEMEKMRQAFGRLLWECFDKWTAQKYNKQQKGQ